MARTAILCMWSEMLEKGAEGEHVIIMFRRTGALPLWSANLSRIFSSLFSCEHRESVLRDQSIPFVFASGAWVRKCFFYNALKVESHLQPLKNMEESQSVRRIVTR